MHALYYLLFGLCLLHHLSAHFDSRGEDCTGEVCHIDALQVAHLLGRWRKEGRFTTSFQNQRLSLQNLLNVTFSLTSIVGHSGLLLIPLFLELNVSQLHNCGANLHDI